MKRLLFLSALSIAALLLLAGCGSVNITAQEAPAQSESQAPAAASTASIAAYPETMHLSADGQDTVQVSGADARDLIWASSDRAVAIVDESGKVTAQGPGNCTISIASKTDSSVSCHVEVTVEAPAAAAQQQTAPAQAATQTPAQAPTQAPAAATTEKQVVTYSADKDPSLVYPAYTLSAAEINAMDAQQTQFVINQIYAKSGYIFSTDSLQAYFAQMPWYKPVSNDVSKLTMSSVDRNNLAQLTKHRDGMSSKPSGLGYLWTYNAVQSPLSAGYVRNLSKSDVQLLIHTIYAKNGYIFNTDSLQKLFSSQGWYHGTTNNMEAVTNSLSSTDRQNLNLLLQYR